MTPFKDTLRRSAAQLGFPLCRVAQVTRPAHGAFVERWLADGNAANMGYLERGLAKRLDPTLVVPGARSIVTLGYPYAPPPVPPVAWQQELRGRIAGYAFGADYHDTIGARLKTLAAQIVAHDPDAGVRTYVDTGPVLEREWAAASGVGWFGKHTNIIHMEQGSWFFLATILTTVELEPDPPHPDRCGQCTRCLDQCPTAALSPGYVLDARRCIAYWTIEHRGMIPRAIRAQCGNWVFGCDICQEVCPWNERFARQHGRPESAELVPYLPDLLCMDTETFRQRYRRTALWRTKREGLARNAAIVLGNTQNPAAIPALRHALTTDASPIVRAHAAWALGRIDNHQAQNLLAQVRTQETDPQVSEEIQVALDGEPVKECSLAEE